MNDNTPTFSEDPEENISMENAFLKMKIAAQFGGDFGAMGGLPPEIENQFLKNILQFETIAANKPPETMKLRELIGAPSFTHSNDIADDALPAALETVNHYFEAHGHYVDFLADYPDRLKYEFITGELLDYESDAGYMIEGMTSNYIYEEFHPNHAYDIEQQAKKFMEWWFQRDAQAFEYLLAPKIPLGPDEILDHSQVIKKMANLFNAFESFENCMYILDQVSYDLDEEQGLAMAFAEGGMKYDAVMDNGEVIHFEGPMKVYFALEGQYWDIMFFQVPGFTWK